MKKKKNTSATNPRIPAHKNFYGIPASHLSRAIDHAQIPRHAAFSLALHAVDVSYQQQHLLKPPD